MTNYHTHTRRCGHAEGSVADYVRVAIEKKMTHLGISDHVPLPDNKWPRIRMPYGELPEYLSEIDGARESFPGIEISKGAECDYAPDYASYFRDELLGEYGMDYLAGGVHYIYLNGEWVNVYDAGNRKKALFLYTDSLIQVIESDLFDFIAHPDVFGAFYHKWDDDAIACSRAILDAASDRKTILEINGSGYRKQRIETAEGKRRAFPLDGFWELAGEYASRVIVNSDAHTPNDVDGFGEGFEMAGKPGLLLIDNLIP